MQAFVYLVVRGITGAADVHATLEHTACRGQLQAFPPVAFAPAASDPIDAETFGAMFGRLPLYKRPLQSVERLEVLFPGRGRELRAAMARQEVADAEAGISSMPDPDYGAFPAAKLARLREASLEVSRAIVAEEGPEKAAEPTAWDRVQAGEGSARAEASDAVVEALLQWQDSSYPTPMALRLLQRFAEMAGRVGAPYRADLASFGRMMQHAGEHVASGGCGVEVSPDRASGIAALAAAGAALAEVAAGGASA